MGIREDIERVEEKVEKQSFAMELLEYSKEQNRQLEKANKRLIGVLVIVLVMWLITIGAFLYYINTTTFEEDYREQTVEDLEGTENISIINGDTYGESKTDKKN